MKSFVQTLCALSLAIAAPSWAQGATATLTAGLVKKIDLEVSKIILQHEEIKHMDMPGMTMVFTVKDKALLSGLKPGDWVKFMASQDKGKMLITVLQRADSP
jgi:Cu/Ag efflux protein CusF